MENSKQADDQYDATISHEEDEGEDLDDDLGKLECTLF